jgi:NADPH:quinone reductase-like Zn-dependent oxidoreductase
MKAVQLVAHGAPGKLELREVHSPKAGEKEVVVRVRACGVNRLDLWAEEGTLPVKLDLPRTLGCEIAGEIVEVVKDISVWRK